MSADHHQLILQLRIRSGDFGNGVKAVLVVPGKFHIDVHFHIHRHIGLQQAVHPPKVLDSGHGNRQRIGMFALIGKPSEGGAAVIENRPARAAAISPIPAGNNHRQRLLRSQEFPDLLPELKLLQILSKAVRCGFQRKLGDSLKIIIFETYEQSFIHWFNRPHPTQKDDLARQLADVDPGSSAFGCLAGQIIQ